MTVTFEDEQTIKDEIKLCKFFLIRPCTAIDNVLIRLTLLCLYQQWEETSLSIYWIKRKTFLNIEYKLSFLGDQIGKTMIMVKTETRTGDGRSLQNPTIEDKEEDEVIKEGGKETSNNVTSLIIVTIMTTEEMITETFKIIEDQEILMIIEDIQMMKEMITDTADHNKEGTNCF